MATGDFSDSQLLEATATQHLPKLNLFTMFRLGLFQIGLGMMSVLIFGVLNRVLIRELGVPATIATIILALTLFVAPARIWFGQMSDTRPLWGLHRTGYVLVGAGSLAVLSYLAVQVMWQVGSSLQVEGWTGRTYGWAALLAFVFGLYGLAVSASSTPFATLLVDVSDEDNRSKLVAIDWSMLIGGVIAGAITIGVLLKKIPLNAPISVIAAGINHLFIVVPLIVFGLALISTWNIEKKYSRYSVRSSLVDQESQITLGRAWRILTASRQTQYFFTFLLAMTMGLFMQDPILEAYGAEVFKMQISETARLNAFWGTGTLIGISSSGFLLTPRIGKRNTAKVGCLLVIVSLIWVIWAGFTADPKLLQWALLFFGLTSGITTTGAITLMLDLTAAETAGTFIGAWGLAQALSRGLSNVVGGAVLDFGKQLTKQLVLAYGLVFVLQGIAMLFAIVLLRRVNVQEFRATSREAILAVIQSDRD
ncbi:MAG: BCD family MFS transporter [Scytolyngbya sp. HA4215-MV1]|jgi:BCD family chlorophyll transporter-like MFS transporter|nr:BCD family MFS transporter [Scytolyngbya sp. HA4215-MV1]